MTIKQEHSFLSGRPALCTLRIELCSLDGEAHSFMSAVPQELRETIRHEVMGTFGRIVALLAPHADDLLRKQSLRGKETL
jgi:hypothetical protein